MSFIQEGPSRQVIATLERDDSKHSFKTPRDLCSLSVKLRKRASSLDEAAGILSLLANSSVTFKPFRIVHGDPWLRRAALFSNAASNRSNPAS
jgi:hypothetical protein